MEEESFDFREEAEFTNSETEFEKVLRPKSFDDFTGQQKVTDNLQIFVQAAKQRGESLDHVLLHGPPGLGKTTLSNIIANELGVGFKVTSGPVLDKPGDLAGLLTNLDEGDVPTGYCFFPTVYDQHYFKMLTAEQLSKKTVKGYTVYFWEKVRERNEALDCRVYARAAASIAGVDRMKPEHWDSLVNTYTRKTTTKTNKKKSRDSDFW